MSNTIVKNGMEIKTGDLLACKTQTSPSVTVSKITDTHIYLRWLRDVQKEKHPCYGLTQEFELSLKTFFDSDWRKTEDQGYNHA